MNDSLFYDGLCPICAREMRLLARLKNSRLTLIDIHAESSPDLFAPNSAENMLAILHLKTADGDWLKGLDAMVKAWHHTRFGWIVKPLRWPIIGPIADRIYIHWARQRACRLGYECSI